jgi:hypothetical protein
VTNLEQLCLLNRFFNEAGGEKSSGSVCKRLVYRHSRLILHLVFLAAQKNSDLSHLVTQELILGKKEEQWLEAATPRARPYLVLGWIQQAYLTHDMQGAPAQSDLDNRIVYQKGVSDALFKIFTKIDVQLPYVYTHIIYWVVYLLLIAFVIEAGTDGAIHFARRHNGKKNSLYRIENHSHIIIICAYTFV